MPENFSASIRSLQAAADDLERDAPSPQQILEIVERGELRPSEDEQFGYWFARFLSIRDSLWSVIEEVLEVLDKPVEQIRGESDWKYFLVGYAALCLLIRIDRVMLFRVASHSIIQRKLNEAFPEYRIPRKQYTKIFSAFVDHGNVIAIRDAIRVAKKNRRKLTRFVDDENVGFIARDLDTFEASLNPSKLSYLKRAWEYVSHKWRRRGVVSFQKSLAKLLEGFGRTASEIYDAGNKRVTPEVIEKLQDILKPGDIVVTRHLKALTNLFLPGFWPHAALYIGTDEQRAALGVSADWGKEQKWAGDLCVLEARKDGVKFRPLDDTFSVDIFTLLRPRLSDDSLRDGIARAVKHEGKLYNFDFDFFNSDRLVCTEVIYRAYDGLEDLKFPLYERASRKTLSAEDLLDYALDTGNIEPIAIFGVDGCDGDLVTGERVRELLVKSYRKTDAS